MTNVFKKMILAVSAAALVFAAFPVTSAYAADDAPAVSNEKLEKAWARQLQIYERIGKAFVDTDAKLAKFQGRIDKAAENGKDVTELQAALDAYSAALKSAQPKYESMAGIVSTHAGFDAEGKVTDAEQARSTVEQMRTGLQDVKSTMGGTFKALREALKAFREANKPAAPTAERDS
jgi:hypothetical protein